MHTLADHLPSFDVYFSKSFSNGNIYFLNNNVENRSADDCSMVFRARKGNKYLKMTFTDWMMQIKKKNCQKNNNDTHKDLQILGLTYIEYIIFLCRLVDLSQTFTLFEEHHHISFIINVCLLCFWTLNIICMRYMCAFTDKFFFISINIFSLSGSAFGKMSSLVKRRKKLLLYFDFMNSIFIYCVFHHSNKTKNDIRCPNVISYFRYKNSAMRMYKINLINSQWNTSALNPSNHQFNIFIHHYFVLSVSKFNYNDSDCYIISGNF